MENLSMWCKLLSCFSIISSLFTALVPDDGIKKAFSTLTAVILVFILIKPADGKSLRLISELDLFGSDARSSEISELEDYSNKAIIEAAENETEKYLYNAVSASSEECTFNVSCEYDKEKIIITRVEVTGDITEETKTVILSEIRKLSDTEAEVIFKGE